MILVRLTRHWRAWNAGETAAFAPDVAAELVASGVAEMVAPAAADTPAPEPEPAPRRRGRAKA